MTNLVSNVFAIPIIFISILGISSNGFICLVNCINLVKSKKMSLSDFIISSLAICRICLLWIIIINALMLFYAYLHQIAIALQINLLLCTFGNFLNVWLSTCLSILYCLKIAHFSHHVFLWFKWKASHVIRWILVASVFFSFFSTWVTMKEFGITFIYRQMTSKANCTGDTRYKKNAYFFNYIFTAFWMVIPFTVSLISYVLIILSLRRHTKQMQNNDTGSRDPSTEAHVRATKIIFSFLLLFILYLVAFLIILLGFNLPDTILALMIGDMVLTAYPSVHSFILIFGNKKLKQTFLGMFQIKK